VCVCVCVCVCETYPGVLDELVAGEGLAMGQDTQRGGTHLLQHRVDPELHQVVDTVHQQLQVPWTGEQQINTPFKSFTTAKLFFIKVPLLLVRSVEVA